MPRHLVDAGIERFPNGCDKHAIVGGIYALPRRLHGAALRRQRDPREAWPMPSLNFNLISVGETVTVPPTAGAAFSN